MATDRPRKNIYLDKSTGPMLEEYAYQQNMSESEVCRQALDVFFMLNDLHSWAACCALAAAKNVHPVEVIDAALLKVLPDKYF